MKNLDKRQRDFCKFKAQGYSNEESAVKAGYSESYAKVSAHKLLDNCEIKLEIERLRALTAKKADEKFGLKIEDVIKDIITIKNHCMQKDKKGKIDSQGATKACDMLLKHLGGYEVDNRQKVINPNITINGIKI